MGRFEKFETWFNILFKKIQQFVKIKYLMNIYQKKKNSCHRLQKFQKWGYRQYLCMKFLEKNDNDVRNGNSPKLRKVVTFA